MLSFTRLSSTALLLLIAAGPLWAQTLPTKWDLQRSLAGAATPTATRIILRAEATCGIDPLSTMLPWSARWDDPFTLGRACQWVDPGTGPIRTTVAGTTYEFRLAAIANDLDGPSALSLPVSFRSPAPTPAVPTGVRVVPGL